MFREIFKTKKPIIGMVHLKELPGQREYKGMRYVIESALDDAQILQEGGVHAICVENWEDESEAPFIGLYDAHYIEEVVRAITERITIPVGVNILPNDYRAAFSMAERLPIQFVWLDVFVDTVRTDYSYGAIRPFKVEVNRKDLQRHRKGTDVLLFTSIHPKHYTLLEKGKTIERSAEQAIKHGADAIVITKATGEAPDIRLLRRVKRFVGAFPVILGSGLTAENLQELLPLVDGAIVGTGVKDKDFDHVVLRKIKKVMQVHRDFS